MFCARARFPGLSAVSSWAHYVCATCYAHTQTGWKRASELSNDPGLFLDDEEDESGDGGAEANDIIQGTLGDCYFLSSLAILCTSKGLGLVEKLFVSQVRCRVDAW